jgi:hypothetical protein
MKGFTRHRSTVTVNPEPKPYVEKDELMQQLLKTRERACLIEKSEELGLHDGAGKGVFLPGSIKLAWWNTAVQLCCLATALRVPLNAGFALDNLNSTEKFVALEVVTECLLVVDICVSFRVAFSDSLTKVLVHKPSEIMRAYLWGWFLPDVVTAIPVRLILLWAPSLVADPYTAFYIQMAKVFVLSRLFKSSRIGLLQEFKNKGKLQPTKLTMLKLIFVFFFVIHMVACTFHFIVTQQHEEAVLLLDDDPPVQRWYRFDSLAITSSFWSRYKLSIYWALVATLGNDVYPGRIPREDIKDPSSHSFLPSFLSFLPSFLSCFPSSPPSFLSFLPSSPSSPSFVSSPSFFSSPSFRK